MSSRRLDDIFSTTIFRLFFKTSSGRLTKTSCEMSSRCYQDVFKTSRRRLGRQNMLCSRCLQDFLKICLENVLKKCLENLLKTNKCFLGSSFSPTKPCLKFFFNLFHSRDKRLLSDFMRKWVWFYGHGGSFPINLGSRVKFQKTGMQFCWWKSNNYSDIISLCDWKTLVS